MKDSICFQNRQPEGLCNIKQTNKQNKQKKQKDKHCILRLVTFQEGYWIVRKNEMGKIKLATYTFLSFLLFETRMYIY